MKFPLLLSSAALALAAPSSLEPRATTFCGQYDSTTVSEYIVYNDLWGEANGSGSQCTTYTSLSGTTIDWSTSWSWSGGTSDVKSFANVVISATAKELSAISSIPSTWSWSYTGSGIVADVAYDMFTSSTASGSSQYEVMVWLAALGGAGPISSTGSTIATPTIDGTTWKLYYGLNGSMKVYSFVASSEVTSFNSDLKAFFTYLIDNEGMSSSQYLTSLGAGTEAFDGTDAVLTSKYSVAIN
ncbi:endoglucanase A precursor [Xylariaceae sp. FL0255]|nr:endoglucanase A precursor [Xylariaceae sp. FL0255]